MQQGDYNTSISYYPCHPPPPPQNPNPNNPTNHHPPPPSSLPSYASAPPFITTNYPPSSFSSSDYPSSYPPPPFPQNPHPSSYTPPNPNPQSFNPPPPPSSQFDPYYAPSYDHHQTPPNYAPPSPIPPNSNPHYSSPFNLGSLVAPLYDNNVKFDQGGGGYVDKSSARYGGYGQSRSDLSQYDDSGGGYGDGVYAYQGSSKGEPYGARGTAPNKSSNWSSSFDDFGRPISFPSDGKKDQSSSKKIVKAVPKAETQQDVMSGVQKFRVKLLAETGFQKTMDVLCQIGLDGIRMLDPGTSRTLRIYPLDTITRCDVTDSSTFSFWSKSLVDIEPRRIRLQSNRYTTNTILDTVTAATVQLKEMGGTSRPADSSKVNEQPNNDQKKKGLGDWMNLMKPVNEEKDHWVPDEAVTKCTACGMDFSAFVRKHHCRNCGDIFCDKCTHGRIALTADENAPQVRVCDRCMAEVTQRLSNAKEAAKRSPGLQSHEDLAKKLQEEMERNRKTPSGSSKLEGSGGRMKEVACPTCTVHLQVQVPSSGSETIECGVCQHPFLVSAH